MKIIAIILGFLIMPIISFAAPLISSVGGSFNHGEIVTITGSGFGTKSPAKPFVWADFDGLSTGANATQNSKFSTGTLISGGGNSVPVVNTADKAHSNSTKSVRAIVYDGTKNSPKLDSNLAGATKLFVSMKRKYAHATWFDAPTNYKFFRLWPNNGNTAVDEIVAYQNYGTARTVYGAEYGSPSPAYQSVFAHPTNNAWGTEEYQASKSSLDTADGTFKMWMNGKRAFNLSVKNRTTTYNSAGYGTLSLENFFTLTSGSGGTDTPPLNAYVYYDDVYIDTTWARVMIGNASTYDSCTHREPLIPTEWSASSITVYFNQGSFNNGENVYVFVIDSAGNVSPGKGIKIGGTITGIIPPDIPDSVPNPPGNLNIN